VVVTGASGFVGGHLVASLQAAGFETIATDVIAASGRALDLRDRAAVVAAFTAWRPVVVVHGGAISGAMLARDDPTLMFDVNMNGTLSVLEAMRSAGVGRLVHLSSNAVYRDRPHREPVGEESSLGSNELYGASKLAAEAVVSAYAATAGIDAWMLRISSIYGPGRRTPHLISTLIDAARTGAVPHVTDSTSNLRQFVHISDVVAAVMAAVRRPAQACTAVNITGGEYLPEQTIAEIVRRHRPELRFAVVPDKGEHGDGRKGPLDIGRAAALLGWRPRVLIERGLADLLSDANAG